MKVVPNEFTKPIYLPSQNIDVLGYVGNLLRRKSHIGTSWSVNVH